MYKILFFLISLYGCSKVNTPSSLTKEQMNGQKLYAVHCMSCHHPNPILTGTIGPDLKGASKELIFMRVQTQDYPIGYNPKRRTNIMPKIDILKESEIQLIYEFIDAYNKVNP